MSTFVAGISVVLGPWLLWKWSGWFTEALILRFVYSERPGSHDRIRRLMEYDL